MPVEQVSAIIGTGLAVIVLMAGVVQYHVGQIKDMINNKVDFLEKQNQRREDEIKELRKELSRDYVRNSAIEGFRADIGNLFEKLNILQGDLRELIGELKGKSNES